MDKLKVVSLNVRGIRGNKRHAIFRWLVDKQYDICLLQETYCTKSFISTFNRGWPGKVIHCTSDSSHSRGVCIMFKRDLDCKIIDVHRSDNGRMILANIDINGNIYSLINVYCPNDMKERVDFFGNISIWINKYVLNTSKLIIGGDFNCVNERNDRHNNSIDKSTMELCKLKTVHGLIDIWRKQHIDKVSFTYIDPSSRGYNARIDFFLCSDCIAPCIANSNISHAPTPDHKAVDICIKLSNKTRGKGYWKMNVSVLQDEQYIKSMELLIKDTFEEYENYINKPSLWEFMKIRIKNLTIKYCVSKAQGKQNTISILEEKINHIDSILATREDIKLDIERREIKQDLETLYYEKAIGYQIRSRAKWVESGERSTRYFLGLEKSRQSKNVIESLKNEHGDVASEDRDILEVARKFYMNLYRTDESSEVEIEHYFDSVHLDKTLDINEQLTCEGDVSYTECEQAVKNMKSNKSPGLDGICVEFYQIFWPLIGQLLVDVFNQGYKEGNLTKSQRTAVMSLIHKKDDKEDIGNYRPISLTNVDYRILAFVLANRLQSVIGKVINNDQTAYIKGRYMGYNIRLINDVIDYYDLLSKPGILLSIDFKKAFDSVEWNFIYKTLQAFNFGESFIRWVKTIYNCPEACIKNNGYISNSFELTRGIRQGCPVSSLLFILCAEILALKIRKCPSLKGFEFGIHEKPTKIVQYADDAMLFINDKAELCSAINVLRMFGQISGTKLNLTKCEGMWLGKDKQYQRTCSLFGIKWPKVMRCLGIYVGHDKLLNEKLNWFDKLDEIRQLLSLWSARDLSIYGKVQIIKTFAVSQLVLVASLLPVPKDIVTEINRMFFKFIWKGKDKLKRLKLINSHDKGGVNMVDISSMFESLKASWIHRISAADPTQSSWVQLANYFLKKLCDINTIKCFSVDRSSILPVLKDLHPFYREVVCSYSYANYVSFETFCDNIFDQPLWGNRFIHVNLKGRKNVLFLRNWIRSGINKIGDLRLDYGKVDPTYLYRTIEKQTNIHTEIALVKKALEPYQEVLANRQGIDHERIIPSRLVKSKDFYVRLIDVKCGDIHLNDMCGNLYELCNGSNTIVEDSFKNQLCSKIEIKLKEFNFKIMHGILPCNTNLMKWRIKDSNVCDLCDDSQSIEHLLFSCRRATYLWNLVNDVYNMSVVFKDIVCGVEDLQYRYIITLLAFLLYKEWLLSSLENRTRCTNFPYHFYIRELKLRERIYAYNEVYLDLSPIIHCLENMIM